MAEELPSWGELASQLIGLVEVRLLDPLEILLESRSELSPVHSRLAERAGAWALALLGEDEDLARRTAIRLVITLYPSDHGFNPPPGWWQTPLGQVMVRRVGHPAAEAVSYAVAGAMLGITRQGVHDLVTRGKLDRHESGGVTTASVQRRITSSDARETRPRALREEASSESGK
ncbi:hypothetical protein Sme01_23810 [Sphaerisporangium melleum]|uniref:Uncharacterized protein n=1 Tax=Sphaerisporangium melleum TaxID=321316 RepID=A0A917QSK8_9ACTN|nr:hypothetical protein [Sphaerisporangium melleum]GGK65873.1 hypothetical protein GCM10007964_06130 [Sphaerisporangium melleum]GII69905.1 hypothetical protein Sme01_23810 [Sphaerisporangium melleum]